MPFCKEKEDTVVSPEFPMVVLLFYRDSHDETQNYFIIPLKNQQEQKQMWVKKMK